MRDHGDGVVAPGVGAGGETDHAGLLAGGVALLDVAGEGGQSLDGDGEWVAVRVGGFDRDLQHRALVDEGVGDVLDFGRAVGVADDDGQHDLAGQGRAGAVAAVGGGHGDRVAAGLGVARGPDDLQGVGVEAGALGQAGDGVSDGGRRALAAGGRGRGRRERVETDLGLEARVVRVEGEHADAQGLAFEQLPSLHRVEDRRTVGVLDVEGQVTRQAGGHRLAAIGEREGGAQGHGDLEQAGLREAGQPGQPAGVLVERGAAGQPGRVPAQFDAAAIGLAEATGHAARQLQVEAVPFAQHLGLQRGEHRLGIALRDVEVEAALHRVLAVAGDDGDVAVGAGLVVAGGPAQQAGGGVEACAGRQVAHQQGDRVAIGIGREQGQAEARALGEGLVRHRMDDRHVVGAGHGQREAAQGHTAAAVDHAQQDFGVGAVFGCRRPLERGVVAVAGGGAFDEGGLIDRHALRTADDLPEEQAAIAVLGADGGGPGLAGLGGRQRRSAQVETAVAVEQAQGRRQVVVRDGIEPVAQVELDELAGARRGAEAAGRAHRDGLRGQGLAVLERLAGQGGSEVQHPQV